MHKAVIAISLVAALGISPVSMAGEERHPGHSLWQAPAAQAGRKNPIPADKDSAGRGGTIYRTHCALCHGEKGKGDGVAGATLNPRPADLTRHARHHSDGDLAWKIGTGRGAMPGFRNVLTENQIWDVVNFIRKGM